MGKVKPFSYSYLFVPQRYKFVIPFLLLLFILKLVIDRYDHEYFFYSDVLLLLLLINVVVISIVVIMIIIVIIIYIN